MKAKIVLAHLIFVVLAGCATPTAPTTAPVRSTATRPEPLVPTKSLPVTVTASANVPPSSPPILRESDNLTSAPPTPIAVYLPFSDEAAGTPLQSSSQDSCEEKPLFMWRTPGRYLYRSGDKYYVVNASGESDSGARDYPNSDTCEDIGIYGLSPVAGIGQMLATPPEAGYETTRYCTPKRAVISGGGTLSTTIAGVEPIRIWEGTVQAVRVDTSLKYIFVTGPHDWFEVLEERSEWYACGYGLVQSAASSTETKNQIPSQSKIDRLKLISFTPLVTNESHVRHILVDIQLGDVAEDYRANIVNEEIAEALRRWGGGIRVVNIDDFERIVVGEQWAVVHAGTENPIVGTEVVLNSD